MRKYATARSVVDHDATFRLAAGPAKNHERASGRDCSCNTRPERYIPAITGAILGISLAPGRSRASESVQPCYTATQRLIRAFAQAFDARDGHALPGCDLDTAADQATFRDQRLGERCATYTGTAAAIAARIVTDLKANLDLCPKHVDTVLADVAGTLLNDDTAAYASFAQKRPELVYAQCWSHTRRMFVKAEADEPTVVAAELTLIRRLYVEAAFREKQLGATAILELPQRDALPAMDAFSPGSIGSAIISA
ncbi:MAG: transposase [Gammaproteobacteria bacterium]|nr:transposase [Gammaproteobacteria bacterium]